MFLGLIWEAEIDRLLASSLQKGRIIAQVEGSGRRPAE